MKKIVLFFLILFSFYSCQMFFGKDDELTMKRRNNEGNKLKLNGYYYLQGNGMIYTYFLFQNGIIRNSGGFEIEKWDEYENNLTDSTFADKNQRKKYNWGIYQIQNDIIQFEKWYPSEKPYRVGKRSGQIINDTTFIITKLASSSGKEFSKKETYRFKKFETKIDSITEFID